MSRKPSNILEVRVSSPRLVWLGFRDLLERLIRLSFLLAVLAAVGWAGHQGYTRVVLDNPDFQLRVIDLNPNSVIDERALVELTGLDLTANITRLDVDSIEQTLLDQPAITAARIERHLPDTLVVRITTRQPRAWVAMPSAGLKPDRSVGGMLVDAGGVPYPCPERQFDEASQLPVILLGDDPDSTIQPGVPLRADTLMKCFRLIDSASEHAPSMLAAIDTLDQPTPWSLRAILHTGTEATFGLRHHDRQLARLRSALAHAKSGERQIATINLIPKENIPVTLKSDPIPSEPAPPRAIPVEEPPTTAEVRREADLNSLLNRH